MLAWPGYKEHLGVCKWCRCDIWYDPDNDCTIFTSDDPDCCCELDKIDWLEHEAELIKERREEC